MLIEIVNPAHIKQLIDTSSSVYITIKETERLLANAQAVFASNKLSRASVQKLAVEINKTPTPVPELHFKNIRGVVTISPVLTDNNLDNLVRPILEPLKGRDISAKGVETTNKKLLQQYTLQAKQAGIPKQTFDFVLKKSYMENGVVQDYTVLTTDGYLVTIGTITPVQSQISALQNQISSLQASIAPKLKKEYSTTLTVPASGYCDFTVPIGNTVIMYKLKLDSSCTFYFHETADRIDSNPYTFVAAGTILEDVGVSMLDDGTISKSNRYRIIANSDNSGVLYARIQNPGTVAKTVSVQITYLAIE